MSDSTWFGGGSWFGDEKNPQTPQTSNMRGGDRRSFHNNRRHSTSYEGDDIRRPPTRQAMNNSPPPSSSLQQFSSPNRNNVRSVSNEMMNSNIAKPQERSDSYDGKETLPYACQLAKGGQLSGHLLKLGENVKKWKRRFFVLRPTRFLYYYLSSGDVEPAGIIDLDLYTICMEVKPEEFEQDHNSNNNFNLNKIEPLSSTNNDATHYRNGANNGNEKYKLKIPMINHSSSNPSSSNLRNVKGWSKGHSSNDKYIQFNSKKTSLNNRKEEEVSTMLALKLIRPDNGDEIILHASCIEEFKEWEKALNPSQRHVNLMNKIELLELEKAEKLIEIRKIDDELQVCVASMIL